MLSSIYPTLLFIFKGFETRRTDIADRLVAWDNLQNAITLSGPLTVNPELSLKVIAANVSIFQMHMSISIL